MWKACARGVVTSIQQVRDLQARSCRCQRRAIHARGGGVSAAGYTAAACTRGSKGGRRRCPQRRRCTCGSCRYCPGADEQGGGGRGGRILCSGRRCGNFCGPTAGSGVDQRLGPHSRRSDGLGVCSGQRCGGRRGSSVHRRRSGTNSRKRGACSCTGQSCGCSGCHAGCGGSNGLCYCHSGCQCVGRHNGGHNWSNGGCHGSG
mmetsp:Transcript_131385/g.327683  ORF Transcript_131385/g.327683 Transcript_131385/m.327683 type:complete len:203 (-) Transcript_131385:174-782(-)